MRIQLLSLIRFGYAVRDNVYTDIGTLTIIWGPLSSPWIFTLSTRIVDSFFFLFFFIYAILYFSPFFPTFFYTRHTARAVKFDRLHATIRYILFSHSLYLFFLYGNKKSRPVISSRFLFGEMHGNISFRTDEVFRSRGVLDILFIKEKTFTLNYLDRLEYISSYIVPQIIKGLDLPFASSPQRSYTLFFLLVF